MASEKHVAIGNIQTSEDGSSAKEIADMAKPHGNLERHASGVVEGTTDTDALALMTLGYAPQMKRQFSYLQLVGCAFTVTNSWLGVAGGFSTGVAVGGSATLIYGLIIMALINLCIVVSLGELVSAFPTSGGQYYWAMKLAPKRLAKISAYFTGICNLLGGLTACASASVAVAYMVLGCAKLVHADFEIHAWQIFLIAVLFNFVCSVVNLHQKSVAMASTIGMFWCAASCVVITVVTPSVAPNHTSTSFIFNSVENISGWSSPGMAFLVGLINANYSFGLIDSAVHLAEEIHHPESQVPKAMLLIVAIGFFTAWPLAIVLMYSMTDFDAVFGTPTLVPLLQLFYFAMRENRGAAIFMQLLIAAAYTWCQIAVQTYQARICWSFSRDGGLPFSKLLSQVHQGLGVPVYAHYFCVLVSSILSVLVVGSTTAFNSLISGVVVFPYLSLILPITYSLLPRNHDVKGVFHLGWLGVCCKVVTLAFAIFATVIYCFPIYMPVSPSSMNYLSAIIGVVVVFGSFDWFLRARHQFTIVE